MAIIDDEQLRGYTAGLIALGDMARDFSGALVNRVGEAAQVFAAGVAADILWGDEVYDVGGWYDDGGDQTVFTVPAGVTMARAFCNVRFSGSFNTSSPLFIQFSQNAVINRSIGAAAYRLNTGIEPQFGMASPAFSVVAGDEISIILNSVTVIATVANTDCTFGIESVVC